ncbi:MAG: hypothetical protein ACLTHL_04855 [Collinsella sp.]
MKLIESGIMICPFFPPMIACPEMINAVLSILMTTAAGDSFPAESGDLCPCCTAWEAPACSFLPVLVNVDGVCGQAVFAGIDIRYIGAVLGCNPALPDFCCRWLELVDALVCSA